MQKYWHQHAEKEALQLATWPTEYRYQHVVCIPAYRENTDFLKQLENIASSSGFNVLVILVINQPESNLDKNANASLLSALHKQTLLWQDKTAGLTLITSGRIDTLCVDRYSETRRIPDKQGVGLARKIACDIAAKLIEMNIIDDDKIFSTDADIIFPMDYFTATLPAISSAGVLPFNHIYNDNEAIHKATLAYEKSHHHYVEGLTYAKSPYAFHTIGSCLIIKADSYIKVRGFPKRSGAEDFYILNKLNKIQPVVTLKAPALFIKSRASNRVPFGTGPATTQILEGKKDATDFFYPQACFYFLRIWLSYLDFTCESPQKDSLENFIKLSQENMDVNMTENLQWMIQTFKMEAIIERIFQNHKMANDRKKAIHHWFDAFKTLKTVRRIKDIVKNNLTDIV